MLTKIYKKPQVYKLEHYIFFQISLTLLFLQAKSKFVNPSVHIHLPCLHIPEF